VNTSSNQTSSDKELPVQSSKSLSRPNTPARPVIDWNHRNRNRQLPTAELPALLRTEAPVLYAIAQVVGKWVWVQFPDKQAPEVTAVLAQLGFHWNNKRQVWQHPCGPVTVDASPEDPRAKHGATAAAAVQPA
jgi:hypothetical protein